MPLFIALFLAITLTAWPSHAQTDGCGSYTPTVIDVQPIYDDIVYEFYTPMLKIKELSEQTTGASKGEQWPVGLSTGEMYFSVTTDTSKMRGTYSKVTCGQVKAVHVQLGFKDNKIYVAKEFPRRSCPFKTALKHEEHHKAIDRAILETYTEQAKQIFADTAQKIGVIRSSAPQLIDDQIHAAISDATERLTKAMQDDHAAQQRAFDSKEEYQRVSDSCDGRTMETVRERLNLLEQTRPGITRVSAPPKDDAVSR
jgi:hypothetical protein